MCYRHGDICIKFNISIHTVKACVKFNTEIMKEESNLSCQVTKIRVASGQKAAEKDTHV